jgi:hypothetical protein
MVLNCGPHAQYCSTSAIDALVSAILPQLRSDFYSCVRPHYNRIRCHIIGFSPCSFKFYHQILSPSTVYFKRLQIITYEIN